MSEVSKNISELLSGTYGKAIVVGGTVYVIKAPSIKVIMRATQYLSKVDFTGKWHCAGINEGCSCQFGEYRQGTFILGGW